MELFIPPPKVKQNYPPGKKNRLFLFRQPDGSRLLPPGRRAALRLLQGLQQLPVKLRFGL